MADRKDETTGRREHEELDQQDLDQVVGGLGNFEIQDFKKTPDPDADDGAAKRQPDGKGFTDASSPYLAVRKG